MRAKGYPLSLLCRTLGVSRAGVSNGQPGAARPPSRQHTCDEAMAQRIRAILDREETVGYRRGGPGRDSRRGSWSIARRCIGFCNGRAGHAGCGIVRPGGPSRHGRRARPWTSRTGSGPPRRPRSGAGGMAGPASWGPSMPGAASVWAPGSRA